MQGLEWSWKSGWLSLRALLAVCTWGALSAACGTPDSAAEAVAVSSQSEGKGSGTLRIGEQTYRFVVRSCYLQGEVDPDDQRTLHGRGTTPDSVPFEVFVTRLQIPNMGASQSVSINIGSYSDIRQGRGTVWAAERVRQAGSWVAMDGSFERTAEPLIQIDGNSLRAEAGYQNQSTDEVREGVLEATCDA